MKPQTTIQFMWDGVLYTGEIIRIRADGDYDVYVPVYDTIYRVSSYDIYYVLVDKHRYATSAGIQNTHRKYEEIFFKLLVTVTLLFILWMFWITIA